MRVASLFRFSAALFCAAFLVACGGGGSGSTPTAGSQSAGNNGPHAASNQGPGTHVTIKYTRHAGFKPKQVSRHATASRKAKYISGDAEGLQVTVSATGIASQTIYADISGGPNCSNVGSTYSCTVTIPTIAANEQLSILETDQTPQNESNGYGTGFANGTNVLAATNATEAVTLGGANNLAFELNPVMGGGFYDCTGGYVTFIEMQPTPTGVPPTLSANFGEDPSGYNDAADAADETNSAGRIVVTGGVASSGSLAVVPLDAEGDCAGLADATPANYVDVNASPAPVSLVSNSAAVTLAPIKNGGTAPGASGYSQTASIADDSYIWEDPNPPFFFIAVSASASLTSTSGTIVLNNNLSATSVFQSGPYGQTMTFNIVPITVSTTAVTVSAAGGTAQVIGTDPGAYYGMDAESTPTANNGSWWWSSGGGDENCNTSGGTTLAGVIPNGGINSTSWQQTFTVTGSNNGTGTCTFYLFDYNALTVTKAVTVTVN